MTTNPEHRKLEQVSMTCLNAARIIMECGGRAFVIEKCVEMMVKGLGVTFLGVRLGYASITVTVSSGENTLTRMVSVGRHGVNHRLDQAIRKLARRTSEGKMTVDQVNDEMNRITKETPHHGALIVSLAVGFACACFGRLLGIDWAAFLPVFFASGLGQLFRRYLIKNNANVYVVASVIAFLAATFSGFSARIAGSETITLAMMASILLLVPGVPATNAQTDIMDGHPTLGNARAVSVFMIMIFATTGAWMAQALLGIN